jgi:aryl-alcohol dehydrogenase-like predicted oxidoreductase
VTPVEEVVSTLTDLVHEGKIRYYGFSDTPAWYVARAQTLAEKESKERIATLQLEYSLVERNIEREHVPVSQELGIGICPWSPLGGGMLSGKYTRQGDGATGEGRLIRGNPVFNKFNDRNWKIVETLADVSQKLGKPAAQVALNWVATQPGMTSTILGATKVVQLEDNLSSLAFSIPPELRQQLDEASTIDKGHPYSFFEPVIQGRISGGTTVKPWEPRHIYEGAVAEKATWVG